MGREYEIKLLAEGSSWTSVITALKNHLLPLCNSFVEGTSIDAYWRALPEAKGAFLRLRVSDDEVTMTSKVNDKGNITDRAEYNVPISDKHKDSVMEALVATLGDPSAIMWKYVDFTIGEATISIIQNLEKKEFTFIEIECPRAEDVSTWKDFVVKASATLTLKQVKNSFFDIFVLRQGILL